MNDEHYMRLAMQLATAGQGRTSPNPIVGAVLVKDQRVIGLGAHLQAGKPHAETHALRMAGEEARGSTLYVTLEPCAHYGKTPPCADAVIAAGVARVVVAVEDPFALVSGQGIERMRAAGIVVSVGCLGAEAATQNAVFLHYARTGRPFVTLKLAATLDGMIATESGDSRYVTGDAARLEVHRLRDQVDAIMVGIQTVLADNPELTVRLPQGGRNPVRVVLDSHLRMPMDARITNCDEAATIIFCAADASRATEEALREKGVQVIRLIENDGRMPLIDVFGELATRGLIHVLVEGGAKLAGACLSERLVDAVWMFHSPKFLGKGITALGDQDLAMHMNDALKLANVIVRQIGEDTLTIGTPVY